MYAGHIGIALGAKGLRREVSLAALILASQIPDWLDATLCLAHCQWGPFGMFTHSLPAILAIAVIVAASYALATGDGRSAMVMGAVTISHVLADYLTGSKPSWPGGPMLGLGWYDHPARDFVIESLVVLAGWAIYRRSLTARQARSPYALAILPVLVAFQLVADVLVIAHRIAKC